MFLVYILNLIGSIQGRAEEECIGVLDTLSLRQRILELERGAVLPLVLLTRSQFLKKTCFDDNFRLVKVK